MITEEMLAANAALAGLPEEARQAIVTLSRNDEAAVIATKVRDIHSQYDEDILAATGKRKPDGVKTYDHLKTVLSELKGGEGKVSEMKSELATLKAEKADLEAKIAGNDTGGRITELERKLRDKETQVTNLQNDIQTKEKEYKAQLKAAAEESMSIRVDNEFQRALSGVKFKDYGVIPEQVQKITIDAAKQQALNGLTPSFEDHGGKMTLIFRDENGTIKTNPDNLQNPATAMDLLLPNLAPIIDEGRQQKGGGTKAPGGGGKASTVQVDTSASREKQDRHIRQQLAAEGLVAGTVKFQERLTQAWEDVGLTDKK